MEISDSNVLNTPARDDSLETADAVARAAHLWIRSLCQNEFQTEDERYAIAGGLVVGLCERLALNFRIQELIAYVYTLLDNEGNQALAVSRLMLDEPVPQLMRRAHDFGRSEAAGIVEMLGYHDHYKPLSEVVKASRLTGDQSDY
jgi:hypothetical protein